MNPGLPPSPWPLKLRELRNHTLDSTRWNDFAFREDDIVIGSWAKSGTTWVQQIVAQVLDGGAESPYAFDRALWVDHRHVPQRVLKLRAARAGRRMLKTHLPVDSLVLSPQARYVFVGRDGRDALWSWYNHHKSLTPLAYKLLNHFPDREGPPLHAPDEDIRAYFHEWLDKDGYPLWPFWSHVRSWWEIRGLPNVLLVHFNRLKADMRGEIARIASFLGIPVQEQAWPGILEHCSFDYLQRTASKLSRSFDAVFIGGGGAFVHRGTNQRWTAVLSQADVEKYESAARANLPADCARWLATGELPGPTAQNRSSTRTAD
jgi:aryl sulfotransferase